MTESLRTLDDVSKDEAIAPCGDALEEVGIDDPAKRLRQYPHELSGGMLQRVMIATALLSEPRLLLADECTTALDVTTQSEVMAILDELRRDRGLSMLFITHDLELAGAVCDRTCVMYAGQVVETSRRRPAPRRSPPPLQRGTGAGATGHHVLGRPAGGDPGPAGLGVRGPVGLPLRPPLSRTSQDTVPRATSRRSPSCRRRVRCERADRAARPPAGRRMSDRMSTSRPCPSRGLRKVFGSFVAVDDLNFDLLPGRSLAIVGESGSGKTTVARMIVGLERPTAGTIVACGRDRSQPRRRGSERKLRGREIQIVFQDPYSSFDPRQSGAALIDEVLRLHRERRRRDRGRRRSPSSPTWWASTMRQINALPRGLSGGQRQRVAIARALATDPRVLILDESVAALDVSIQAQVLNVLADIRDERQISYVLICHDLAVVRQLTEEALVMQRGKVVERGETGALLDSPQHPYTQMLRASVPGPGWKPSRSARAAAKA